ncbi:MAG: hypothetical protein IPG58_14925 [Acidobacteria bacterium]|nr:hypothetical protein [Acidobacteriota bacterium]
MGFSDICNGIDICVVVSSLFSFGRLGGKFTNFSLKVGSVKGSARREQRFANSTVLARSTRAVYFR